MTSTRESSEAPREAAGDLGLVGAYARGQETRKERAKYTTWLDEATDLTPAKVDAVLGKVSSPELAKLAAKYVNMSAFEMGADARTATDVRSLAASVLAQAQGTPRR